MTDHMARGTQKYRTLIKRISLATAPLIEEDLKKTVIDGFNAWEIAVEIEGFTVRWLGKDLYEDRLALSGGEELNCMELWRN